MGSPRKGESYKIMQLIQERLQQREDVVFDSVLLRDYNLGQCTGCHLCIFKEGHKCPLNNDRELIEMKMREADGIILISPLYSQHVTALMKNFIDQLSYLWHRPRYFGKKAMVVVTGGAMFKVTLNFMADTAKRWGYHVTNKVGIPHLDALTERFKEKILTKLYKEVDGFYTSIKAEKKPVPNFGDVMWFEMWKGNSIAMKKSHPADYEYWSQKGWIDGSYYYPTHISVWKKLAMRFIGSMGAGYMKKMYKDY
jgi:multimeric flavodoxin WrbA